MNTAQEHVLDVLDIYGPLADTALVPLAQHMAPIHQSSSGIRTRRSELTRMGKIKQVGMITLPSGRDAAVWDVKNV
jgi:hypothetical protein